MSIFDQQSKQTAVVSEEKLRSQVYDSLRNMGMNSASGSMIGQGTPPPWTSNQTIFKPATTPFWQVDALLEAAVSKVENGYLLRVSAPGKKPKTLMCATHDELGSLLVAELVLLKLEDA
jgi:hypothetical protein